MPTFACVLLPLAGLALVACQAPGKPGHDPAGNPPDPAMQGVAADAVPASVALPAAVERVLTDYEAAWRAGDEDALAALFTEDGWVLSNGRPPTHGRDAIRARYADSGGALFLRAFAWGTDGELGYVLGGFAYEEDGDDRGKFTLVLRRNADGRWLIVSDMDNGNRWPG